MKYQYLIAIFVITGIGIFGYVYLTGQETVMNVELHENSKTTNTDITIPSSLTREFENTDFSQADSSVENIISGGPGKDGIPSIDDPDFIPLSENTRPDSVQAIVMKDGDGVKVYPYNILIWHEIVNDTVNDTPVAVTFCPLCGSAIAFDRSLPNGVTTFGVSGYLIESNMVMYDRDTESLWQQSTGKALAGEYFGEQLEHVPFQLMTLGDVREKYTDALVLSEDTGYGRNYGQNPYAGYDESDNFIFPPSEQNDRYDSKEIFVVFRVDDTVAGVPWKSMQNGDSFSMEVDTTMITLEKEDSELSVTTSDGETIPFYFEMWFSFITQNDDPVVRDPR